MKESVFQSEWTRSINTQFASEKDNYYYHKIPDMASRGGYTAKKPYDNEFFYKNHVFAFELKQIKSLTGFPFNRVEDHQIKNLLRVENSGKTHHGYVVINYRKSNKLTEKEKKKLGENTMNFVIALPINMYLEEMRNSKRKSLSFDEALDFKPFWAIYKRNNLWDIKSFLLLHHQI